MADINVGIVGMGTYLPEKIMTAKEISDATNGVWSEDAVINKLGIVQKYVPSDKPCDGTQEMGALAALKCLENTGFDPLDIDVILCITEEWKEYPLTTSACYVQDRFYDAKLSRLKIMPLPTLLSKVEGVYLHRKRFQGLPR